MITNKNGIRNIIFDLGGVILNIDYKKTEQAFINLGIVNLRELYSQFNANSLFTDFETGKLSRAQFLNELKRYKKELREDDIITAWNAMLLEFPVGRIEFLQSLQKRYRLFLLSNTNPIHHEAFQKIYIEFIGPVGSLDNCFEKAYYSHVIGFRKPDPDIYNWVIKENALKAEETLFIDDTPANVEAAKSVNMKGLYLAPGETIEELLIDY